MSTWLIVYEPLMEITTFSWKHYFFPKKNEEVIDKYLETKKFLKIQWSRVNVSSIDTIDPAKPEDNFYQEEIKKYNYEEVNIIKTHIWFWKDKTQKDLTPSVLKQIIDTNLWKKNQ